MEDIENSSYITYLHNSNQKQHKTTLTGEKIENEKFTVIGFVPADVVRLKGNVWFRKLEPDSIKQVDLHIRSLRGFRINAHQCIREKANFEGYRP